MNPDAKSLLEFLRRELTDHHPELAVEIHTLLDHACVEGAINELIRAVKEQK